MVESAVVWVDWGDGMQYVTYLLLSHWYVSAVLLIQWIGLPPFSESRCGCLELFSGSQREG
jgi:hypothetical protein